MKLQVKLLSARIPVFVTVPLFRVRGFLNLTGKGEILPGNDADLLVMTPELRIEQVYARGKLMVKDGKACVKGTFETA